jgi:hypothetical protein
LSAFTYKYRVPGIVKVPVEVAGKVCQDIIDLEGAITPKRLVDVSRPEDAPLHGEFEWNDNVAAEKYREEQARQIIKNIIIVDSSIDEERQLNVSVGEVKGDRAFVPTDERTHKYIPLYAALSEEAYRENLIQQAKRDMYAFRIKYFRLKELEHIIKDIDDFLGA